MARLLFNADRDRKSCERCGASFDRPNGVGRPEFATYRFCSRACSQKTIAEARAQKRGGAGAVKSRKRAAVQLAKAIESTGGEWEVYRDDKPTRQAATLTEARAQANIGKPHYAEIANLVTGQHLMLLDGKWIETRPVGSRIERLRARG